MLKSIEQQLYQILADCSSAAEVEQFFNDFFTPSEKASFTKRLAVALELQNGRSYEAIRKKYGVSTATISTVANFLHKPGFSLILQKLKEDHKARDMTRKLVDFFKLNYA
jgi:TrpR-related protein YerC/YecD